MAEPAENLNPQPALEEAPNVQFGTFLQFGKSDYRNVTVTGMDHASGNIIAFRRVGDQMRRVLIPKADYDEALKIQKAVEKRTGRKQKAFLAKFVGSLLNRSITHEGESAQVIGYDAQRGEALVTVNGQPQWIGAAALVESQKNIKLVKTNASDDETESDKRLLESAKKIAHSFGKDSIFEHVFTEKGKKEFQSNLEKLESAIKKDDKEEIKIARENIEKNAVLLKKEVLENTKKELKNKTDDQKAIIQKFISGLDNVETLESFEKQIGKYVQEKEKWIKAQVKKEAKEPADKTGTAAPAPTEGIEKKPLQLSEAELDELAVEAQEPELIVEELSEAEAEQITAEAEAIELQEALQNAKVVEALEGASIANVLPAPLIKSLSVPVASGSVAEKRRDLQIEQAYQTFAKGKSPEDLAKVLGGLTQEFKQIDASTLPEMQPLREIQAKLVTAAASDLKSKGVLLPEISARLTGDSLQTARDLAVTVEVGGGVPVAAVLPAVVSVAAPVASTQIQAEILPRAQAAVEILGRQISDREASSRQIHVQISQASDKINQLNQRAASLPAGDEERVVIEAELSSAEGERRSLQDQLTNISVQLGNDRRDQSALKASIANISQAPAGQAPPELVTDLANKIPARLAPQIAEPSVIPAKAGIQPEPVDSRFRGNDTVQPVPTAPARRVSPSAPAPVRSPSAPVQQVRAPLRALPNVGRDSQRAAQLISDQQEDFFDGQELPEESEELIPDTYEQAMSEEGGVGGELSPLEIGTQMPDTSMTYAAGGNVEESPEPGDFFMEREAAGRKRMADVNRQAPARPARDTSRTATDIARKPAPPAVPAGQTPAPTAAGAPNARESSRFQKLLNQQSRAIAKRDQAQAGFDKLKTAQDAQANLDSIKKLKRIYDVAKAGSALTFWGIVVAVLIANIQTINKYTVKIKVIPSTTLVEDVAIVILDLMLLQVMICATAILLVVPAIIIAVIVGAFTFADASGFFDLISGIFS